MLEDIVREIGDDLAIEHQLYYPQTDKPRAILTTCATGLGAAANLSALLKPAFLKRLALILWPAMWRPLPITRDGSC